MTDHEIKLTTGRFVCANEGIIGIRSDLSIAGGYDQMITDMHLAHIGWNCLTPAEVQELADIAIDRWQRLKAWAATG